MNRWNGILVLIMTAVVANAQTSSHFRDGNRWYKERKFDRALFEYQEALRQNPSDPVINYNLGDAYFRNEKYEEAEKAFDIPIAEEKEDAMRQRAFYNKGVSLSRQNKLEESIDAYKNAVLLDPADEDARINLQKALLELKKKNKSEKENKETENENNQKKKNEQPPPAQNNLTKKQVEQLLKALQQREQQVQQKMLQNRGRAVTNPDGKDW